MPMVPRSYHFGMSIFLEIPFVELAQARAESGVQEHAVLWDSVGICVCSMSKWMPLRTRRETSGPETGSSTRRLTEVREVSVWVAP